MGSSFEIVIRAVIIYLFVILAIRLFGKKELAQLSVIDLVFILLISNSVQASMVGGDTTLWGGMIAATALFFINYLLKLLLFKSKTISEIVQGKPLMLIYRGEVIHAHLEQAKITMEELEAAVREHGVESVRNIDLAILEVDGNISVLSKNFQRASVKKRKAHKALHQSTT